MPRTAYWVCNHCEALCGLVIEHDGERVLSVKGDPLDPLSRGHICPKGATLGDLHDDPDRLRHPLRRRGDRWEPVSWDEAFSEAGHRLAEIQQRYGDDAVALYYGDPVAHNFFTQLALLPFVKTLRSRNIYSATSVDSLPRTLASLLLYGNQAAIPVPDLDRTHYFLILGANPAVSNGSIMTAPGCADRLRAIRRRGGRVVLLDPRRTETARLADEHIPIRPGTDALFLLALIHTFFEEGRVALGPLASQVEGLDTIREIALPFTPEAVAPAVRIEAAAIRRIAREFAHAPSAVCYGRMGTSVQAFGGFATFLEDVVNILTGNLDREGGSMFATPAADMVQLARLLGETGTFDRYRSRVRGLPEFNGELPAAVLAEEMETPGPGRIRALVCVAGNIGLSLPNSGRLERAMRDLEYFVSVDIYRNETSRLADLILPPASRLTQDNYHVIFHALAVRNTARFAPALFPRETGTLHDWEILSALGASLKRCRGGLAPLSARVDRVVSGALTPRRQLDLMFRIGPRRLTLRKLEAAVHGIDFGPLEPRLHKILGKPLAQGLSRKARKIDLLPELFLKDVVRLRKRIEGGDDGSSDALLLVGRRGLRDLNSWLHNLPRLMRGKMRCTLKMHPHDAEARGLENGREVRLSTRIGAIEAPLEVTDEMMPGVVSLPHGWGHDKKGADLKVAGKQAGVCVNRIIDDALVDETSGTSILYGVPVAVEPSSGT